MSWTRRGALALLGAGILGGGGWAAATRLGGDDDSTAGPASVPSTATTDPGSATTTEPTTPTPSIVNRLNEVNAVGNVIDRQITVVDITVGRSPGGGDIDLEDVVIQWVTSAGSEHLIAYRDGNPDAETVQGESPDEAAAFSWEPIRDEDSSIENENVLNAPEDRATITIDLVDEPGLEPLAEGSTANAQFVTGSGGETMLALVVPDTLAEKDAVAL